LKYTWLDCPEAYSFVLNEYSDLKFVLIASYITVKTSSILLCFKDTKDTQYKDLFEDIFVGGCPFFDSR
jgi:hypothetical protein